MATGKHAQRYLAVAFDTGAAGKSTSERQAGMEMVDESYAMTTFLPLRRIWLIRSLVLGRSDDAIADFIPSK